MVGFVNIFRKVKILKKSFFWFLVFIFIPYVYLAAVEGDFYHVCVQDSEKSFAINLKSEKMYSTARYLQVVYLKLKLPMNGEKGLISAKLEIDYSAPTSSVIGSFRGVLEFFKGVSLPKLVPGKYMLVLDSMVYGIIDISKKGVFFQSFIEY